MNNKIKMLLENAESHVRGEDASEIAEYALKDVPALCGEVRTLTEYLTALVHVENKIKRAKTGRETGEFQEVRANIMKTIAEHINMKLG